MESFKQFQFVDEEGRQEMYKWSEKRRMKYKGFRGFLQFMRIFAFDKGLLKSFLHNINLIVVIQMVLAGVVTFLCSYANLFFDVHVTLFVSPLVFPLAFSINTDFQRREKVLEDLANFKASTMVWFFCLRDWSVPADFSENFMKSAFNKTKGLMFHLREYLLTEKSHRRDFIIRIIYEDLSDIAELNEKIRSSNLPTSAPLIARTIHLHYLMCLSFERLRVIREYRSPRSIRSFTKVFIFALPLLLAPYYVHLGRTVNSIWSPYFIAILVAFLFGALQGVQDKLDDPFDGMSEDDIDLDTLDEWTVHSLEATANRTTKVGRFTVSVFGKGKVEFSEPSAVADRKTDRKTDRRSALLREESFRGSRSNSRKKLGLLPWQRQLSQLYSDEEAASENTENFKETHPYSNILSNLPGNATIVRGGHVKEQRMFEEVNSSTSSSSMNPVLDPSLFQVHTPGSSIQRSLDSYTSNAARKLQCNKVLFDRDPTALPLQENEETGSYSPTRFDMPTSFKTLFVPEVTQNQVAIQMDSMKHSIPSTSFKPCEGPGTRWRNMGNDRSESVGMVAHPGVGVASYINAMNKDKFRKASSCSLRGSFESKSLETDLTSMSSDENQSPERTKSLSLPSGKKKFRVQRAKTLSLEPVTPTLKDDTASDEPKSDDSNCKNTTGMPKTNPGINKIGTEKLKPKPGSNLRVRSTSKTKLLDCGNSFEENDLIPTKNEFETKSVESSPKSRFRKFTVKKSGSDSNLIHKSPETSSSESLSNVVGKLKDEEVFL